MKVKRKPLYVLPGANPGLVVRGNIDINNRPSVPNPYEGGISTVFSVSFNEPSTGLEVLIPQVIPVNGRYQVVNWKRAEQYYFRTHQHLGKFDTVAHANTYANKLHIQQAKLVKGGG